jgi:ferredoxin
MRRTRPVIEINEDLCTGCGDCVQACAEGALAIVDGKAKLVGEIYCDGLGACLSGCPTGALKVVEREVEEFDEQAVHEHLKSFDKMAAVKEISRARSPAAQTPAAPLACGCPGTMVRTIEPCECGGDAEDDERRPVASELRQWPIKLSLLGPSAPFLKGSDLVLLADCAGVSLPDLHRKVLRGHAVVIGCPKLDDLEAHVERLAQIIAGARPRSLTVVHMQVPCCRGFVWAAEKALALAKVSIPLRRIEVSASGQVVAEEELIPAETACAAG